MSEKEESEFERPEDYEAVCGAPDEPIRRQRQTVSHLEDIEETLSEQTNNLNTQNQQIGDLLKRISGIGLIIAVLIGLHVIRHW